MNINFERPIMIFRKDFDNGTVYRFGASKKNVEGEYENGYITCQFKKDVEIENMTKIFVKSAWLSFYNTKEKKTIPYIFINEFDYVDDMEEVNIDDFLTDDSEEEVELNLDDNYLD